MIVGNPVRPPPLCGRRAKLSAGVLLSGAPANVLTAALVGAVVGVVVGAVVGAVVGVPLAVVVGTVVGLVVGTVVAIVVAAEVGEVDAVTCGTTAAGAGDELPPPPHAASTVAERNAPAPTAARSRFEMSINRI